MYKEVEKEDGHVRREKTVEHGREVLPGGLHKFGKINKESQLGASRARGRAEKGKQHEKEREKVERKKDEDVQKESLYEQ